MFCFGAFFVGMRYAIGLPLGKALITTRLGSVFCLYHNPTRYRVSEGFCVPRKRIELG